jgi:hypothetical protein
VGGVFMSSASLVHASTGDDRRGGVTATYLAITFLGLVVPVVVTGFAADHLSQVQATGVFSAAISLVVLTACYLTRGLSWRSTGYDVVEPV